MIREDGLSSGVRNIIKDVDKITNQSNIFIKSLAVVSKFIFSRVISKVELDETKTLLKNYTEKEDRDFIQKYAETRLASIGTCDIAISAYCFALAAFMVSLASLMMVPLSSNGSSIVVGIVILALLAILALFLLISHVGPKLERYEAIIIAVEAAKLDDIQKKPRDRAESSKKDPKTIALLLVFIITVCLLFYIMPQKIQPLY